MANSSLVSLPVLLGGDVNSNDLLYTVHYPDGGGNAEDRKLELNNFVTTSGDHTLNGALTVNAAFTAEEVAVTQPSGIAGKVSFKTDGSRRWEWERTADAETGSNAGSKLILNRYADDGNYLSTILEIDRQAGSIKLFSEVLLFGRTRIPSNPPASSTANGGEGELTWDSQFIYICTASNSWKRISLQTF